MMIVLILIMFSCKSAEKSLEEPSKNNVLVYYSKGPCLGKCPVYDLWIYKDGTVIYKGVDKVNYKGEIRTNLSSDELEILQSALSEEGFEVENFKRVRDLPITRLKYGIEDRKFYVSKIYGPLKKVNTLLELIVKRIT